MTSFDETKFVAYVTPKCYYKIMHNSDLKNKLKNYELVATVYVYMNMMGGWTEEECDNVIYLVPKGEANVNDR